MSSLELNRRELPKRDSTFRPASMSANSIGAGLLEDLLKELDLHGSLASSAAAHVNRTGREKLMDHDRDDLFEDRTAETAETGLDELPIDAQDESREPELAAFGDGGLDPAERRMGRRSGAPWIVAIALVLATLGVGGYFWWQGRKSEPLPVDQTVTTAETVPTEAIEEEPVEEPIEVPPLDASDEIVRRLVAGLSARPELARWLATDDLVRRFAAAVDNVASGANPKTHVRALTPEEPFEVSESDGALRADPASYRRYDTLTAVVTSLDTEGSARLYRTLRPLLDEAYRDLGYPSGSFDEVLARAIRKLLAAPVESAGAELTPGVLSYKYSDPELEALSPAQKQLLRLGPQNARRVQAKLRELARAIDLEI